MAPSITGPVAGPAAESKKDLKRKALPQSLSDAASPSSDADVKAAKKAKKEVEKAAKATAKAGAAPKAPKAAASAQQPAASAPAAVGPKPELSDVEYRKLHDITVKGGQSSIIQSFDAAPFPASLIGALKAAGFAAPSPIQALAWPLAMTGRDVLATAKTGSGKTCGYLLPAMAKLLAERAAPGAKKQSSAVGKGAPAIVVMAPTRELAMQINTEAQRFAKSCGLKSVAVYGGAPKGPQIREIQSGAQIIIATPGRLNDLLAFTCHDGSQVLSLDACRTLVLDEADRMCDMGFEEDIKKIVAMMPGSKQTLFFTATWPKSVARVAASILNNPISIEIGSNDTLRANKDIKQVVQVVDQREKRDLLMELVKKECGEGSRTIIFANKKWICDDLESALWDAGYNIAAIHGDKEQRDREWAVQQMRDGKLPLLVATDVAARGLDIKGLDRVINFDFPNNTEDYVHRIGRTGRAGATGTANTFFTDSDAKHAGDLVKVLKEAGQVVTPELEALCRRGGGGGNSRFGGGRGGGGRGGRGGGRGGGRRW
ncbi:hypothetical protein FOA52_004357 [Chlamydomonas sp. UWO 241]|nr:hypothetical protein FOA52_004357 [Chlamydomonas sp. UWO 241]